MVICTAHIITDLALVQVVAYVVVRRLAYFVPSGMLPSLATLSGRGSFVSDNLGDPAPTTMVDGDVFYDPARNPDINPEPYTGLDGPAAVGRGAGAAVEPEWRSAREVMAEQARLAARDAGDRGTGDHSAGAGPSAAPAHGANAMQHGYPPDTSGPGAVRDAATQTADDRGALASHLEAGVLAEPAAGPAARTPPHEPPAVVPPPPPPPAAPAAGVRDLSASGTVHDERGDSAAQAAPAAVAEHLMADSVQAAAQAAGSGAGPAVGEDDLGGPGAAAGTEPNMAPAGGDSEAPETQGPAEGAAVGGMSGAAAGAAAPAADQAGGGSEGAPQGAAGGGSAGSSVSSGAEALERSQAAPAVTPQGAEHKIQQPAAGEASPAHAPAGDPDPDPDPAAADDVDECSADSAGTCAAPLGTADPAGGAASPELDPESGSSGFAAASAHGGASDAAATSAALPAGNDGAPDVLGTSAAAADAAPAGVGVLADTEMDVAGAHAPGEAAAAGPPDAHLDTGVREPSMEPHVEHGSAAAEHPSADAAPLSEDAAAAATSHGSEGDSAAQEPADGGASAGAPPGTPAEAGPGVSEQADATPAPAEPRAATGFAAGHAPADDAEGASGAALFEPAGGRDPGFLDADAPVPAGASNQGPDSIGSGLEDTNTLQASRAGERLEAGREDWAGGPASEGVAESDQSGENGAEGLRGHVGGAGTDEKQSGADARMPAAAGAAVRPAAQPAAQHDGSTADVPAHEPVIRDEL